MYLHLGGTMIINTDELILVENLERIGSLDDWLRQKAKATRQILDISGGNPKAAVYTNQQIILSPISSVTLKKRLKQIPM